MCTDNFNVTLFDGESFHYFEIKAFDDRHALYQAYDRLPAGTDVLKTKIERVEKNVQ